MTLEELTDAIQDMLDEAEAYPIQGDSAFLVDADDKRHGWAKNVGKLEVLRALKALIDAG